MTGRADPGIVSSFRIGEERVFDDLIVLEAPPPNRVGKCDPDGERLLPEAAVMLAYAMHLLRTETGCVCVEIHPDGEHGKRFGIRHWLEAQGFQLVRPTGKTSYGGDYKALDGRTLVVHPASGLGDIVANVGDRRVVAEAKGGIVNTRHAGPVSKLRRGLCEAVGLLLATPADVRTRQVAVVPKTKVTEGLAAKMAERVRLAGIGHLPGGRTRQCIRCCLTDAGAAICGNSRQAPRQVSGVAYSK